MASSTRVTPSAVTSLVRSGWFQRRRDEALGGQVVHLGRRHFLHDRGQRDLVVQVGLVQRDWSWRWAIRSKFSVLDRRTTPWTA